MNHDHAHGPRPRLGHRPARRPRAGDHQQPRPRRGLPRPHRAPRRTGQRRRGLRRRGGSGHGRRVGPGPGGREPVGPLHGLPMTIKDNQLTARPPHHLRQSAPAGSRRRRRAGGPAPRRRCGLHRQDQHPSVRAGHPDLQPPLRHDHQPMGRHPHLRRLVGGAAAAVAVGMTALRARQRPRRLDPPPRLLLRRLRAQVVLGPRARTRPPSGQPAPPGDDGHGRHRSDRPQRRGPRPHARDHRRAEARCGPRGQRRAADAQGPPDRGLPGRRRG